MGTGRPRSTVVDRGRPGSKRFYNHKKSMGGGVQNIKKICGHRSTAVDRGPNASTTIKKSLGCKTSQKTCRPQSTGAVSVDSWAPVDRGPNAYNRTTINKTLGRRNASTTSPNKKSWAPVDRGRPGSKRFYYHKESLWASGGAKHHQQKAPGDHGRCIKNWGMQNAFTKKPVDGAATL